MKEEFDFSAYNDSIHRIGRLWLLAVIVVLLSVPFLFSAVTGAHIEWKAFLKASVPVLIIYVPTCIVEFLVYVPLIGPGGSYLAFMTGNITNLKLPCAFSSRDIARTEVGTAENEIISTLAIATSSLVTMLVLTLGIILLIPLTPVLQSPTLKPAFDNVLPALFGALGMQYFRKSLKITVFPLSFMVLLCIIVPSMINSTSFLIIVCGGLAIALSYVFYRKHWLD